MTIDEFWNLIERSRKGTAGCEEQVEKLTALLTALPSTDIVSFEHHFNERMSESYRWDLWAVAFIIQGGCSDDSFDYFRGWLIAQGRDYFEAAMNDPIRAADKGETDDGIECEEILVCPAQAYREVTGQEMPVEPYGPSRALPRPRGEPWSEDDLPRLFPELCKRFGWEV